MTHAPVLEIPDLAGDGWRLRAWHPDDADALVRAWTDPAVLAGSTPPADTSPAAARRWIEGCDERRRAGLALDLVIAGVGEGIGDPVMGEVGLARLDASRRAASIGWWLAPEHRGRGLAGRVVDAFASWLLEGGGLRHLVAEIEPTNAASIAVATKAGFEVLRPPSAGAPGVWRRSAR